MWILKVFWIEMIIFPIILVYLFLDVSNKSGLQIAGLIMYAIVFFSAIAGYLYTWKKKKKD